MAEQPITRSELREELKHYATKADLSALEIRLIKWLIGTTLVAVVAAASITTAVLNALG